MTGETIEVDLTSDPHLKDIIAHLRRKKAKPTNVRQEDIGIKRGEMFKSQTEDGAFTMPLLDTVFRCTIEPILTFEVGTDGLALADEKSADRNIRSAYKKVCCNYDDLIVEITYFREVGRNPYLITLDKEFHSSSVNYFMDIHRRLRWATQEDALSSLKYLLTYYGSTTDNRRVKLVN